MTARELCPFAAGRGFVVSARPWGLLVEAEQPISLLSEGEETPTQRGRRARVPFGTIARIGDTVIAPLDAEQLEAARRSGLRVIRHAPAAPSPWTGASTPWRPIAAAVAALVATIVLLEASVAEISHNLGFDRLPTPASLRASLTTDTPDELAASQDRVLERGLATFHICPGPMLDSGYISLSRDYPNHCFAGRRR